MSKRYCKTCQKETLHDKVNDNIGGGSILARAYWGIFSLGVSEMTTTYWYKCQCCDRKTKI